MTWNNSQASLLEAWLSRGDRRIAEVIYHAWNNGARFDAWSEHFKFDYWEDGFKKTGLNPGFYSQRQRESDEIFPWDHINTGMHKKFLIQDYEGSKAGKTRPDCRNQCYACGILSYFSELRPLAKEGGWACP
jgi:hypothetical protein